MIGPGNLIHLSTTYKKAMGIMTPISQELTMQMGKGILTYTRTEDGRYISVWSENI